MQTLGVIGFGTFGQLVARHLKDQIRVFPWDLKDQRKKAASLGLTWSTLEEAASCSNVLLAVPIGEMPTALAQVGPYLRPGALLMDVCSVKLAPVEWMLAAAPSDVEVLGIHPLLGPVSSRAGILGSTVVLCPGRTTRIDRIRAFIEGLGLRVVITSAREHDRHMAYSQALTHFLIRGLDGAGIVDRELQTPSFERLMRIMEALIKDSPALFRDMQTYNPFAAEARSRLLEALIRLDHDLVKATPADLDKDSSGEMDPDSSC